MGLFLRLIKYTMKQYKLQTLVDITETHARRGEDPKAYKQQQNWMTLVQTLGLRCNPIVVHQEQEQETASQLGLGTSYKGKQTVWTVVFDFEHASDEDLELLDQDFDLVPIAADLDESVELQQPIFQTKDTKLRNIVFSSIR